MGFRCQVSENGGQRTDDSKSEVLGVSPLWKSESQNPPLTAIPGFCSLPTGFCPQIPDT